MLARKIKTFRLLHKGSSSFSRTLIHCLLLAVLFCLAGFTNSAAAATYYLDAVNGNDANTGDSTHPWKTINRACWDTKYAGVGANPLVVAGDTVILQTGEYDQWKWMDVSDPGDWVTYRAATGATAHFWEIIFGTAFQTAQVNMRVIIDGMNITWTGKTGPEIYLVKFMGANYIKLKNSYLEGLLSPYTGRAVTIKSASSTYSHVSQYIEIDNCEITTCGNGITGSFVGDRNGATENGIIIKNCNIHHLTDDAISFSEMSNSTIEDNQIYDLACEKATVILYDIYDTITGTFTIGETVTQGAVSGVIVAQASGTHQVVYINSSDYYTAWSVDQQVMGQLSGVTVTPSSRTDGAHPDAIQLYAAVPRIWTLKNNIIRRNVIHDTRGQGIFLHEMEDVLIENNLLYGAWYASAIKVEACSISGTIRNNTICKTVSTQADIDVESNIYDWATGQSYRTGWNVLSGGNPYRCIVTNTSSVDNQPPNTTYWMAVPVLTFNVHNNLGTRTIIYNAAFGQVLNEGNNICGGFSFLTVPGPNDTDYEYRTAQEKGQGDWNMTSAEMEALFTDYANDDFTLKSTAKAVNFGSSTDAPISDILGVSRVSPPDAGCYEYVAHDPNNHAPVLQTIGDKNVSEGTALAFNVTATDADSDTINYSKSTLPTGAAFANQVFSWTPTYSQAGTYQITFYASDGQAQDSETITITVTNVNRTPVLAAIGNKSVDEGATLSFTISATDPDGDTITYSIDPLPAGAAFNTTTGAFSWTPGYDQAGPDSTTFTATDGTAEDTEAITITVNNVDRPPTISSIGNQSVFAAEPLTFSVSATDPDGDAISYSTSSLPTGATFDSTNHTFNWTPTSAQAGSYPLTFTADSGTLSDSETITIAVTADTSAPTVTTGSPAVDAIQVPLNNLITLNIADTGKGVDPDSVIIKVNNNLVYIGDSADYSSSYGHCRRSGTNADYTFVYQPNDLFDSDQTVAVTVDAADLIGNAMSRYSYSFATEMRMFGQNLQVNSASNPLDCGKPETVCDSSGNIWAVWHAGPQGQRDIYLAKMPTGATTFADSIQMTSNEADQCNPSIAVDPDGKLYLAWQDNRYGNWDIYVATSTDGTTWANVLRLTSSNYNQTNPITVVDAATPVNAYVAWQDDTAGNQDIYIMRSTDRFVSSRTLWQVTSNTADQTQLAAAVDATNKIYLLWTDTRNGNQDIYGASSADGPWTNVPVVVKTANQSQPAIAAEAAGSILHVLWADDTAGNNDIYYASSNTLPTSSLTGTSIIDTTGYDQQAPAIAVTGSTGNSLKVFSCWQDFRNVSTGGDTDLYFYQTATASGQNIFVGDDGTNSSQSIPAMGINADAHPYLVWVDNRNTAADIYYAGSTFLETAALASGEIPASTGGTVGTLPDAINDEDDVSVVVPAGAYPSDITIEILSVENPPKVSCDRLSLPYEFSPSGITFSQPVTITIPYSVPITGQTASIYWYDPLTASISQQGITDAETIEISPTLYALRFKTTHFTQFFVGSTSSAAGGGGGGGGCSMSSNGQGGILEYMLPYAVLVLVMIILRLNDARKHKARNVLRNK